MIVFLSCCDLGQNEVKHSKYLKAISLFVANLIFLISLTLLVFFDQFSEGFQYHFSLNGLFSQSILFGVDGLSIVFIILITFISSLSVLIVLRRTYGLKFLLIYIFLIEFFCLVVFSVLDILLFYMFFESILMPMFLMIGI